MNWGFGEMDKKDATPKVGVAVFLFRDDKVLLGKRIGSHCAGTMSAPGGHMKCGETFFDCCAREVKEETGIIISGIRNIDFANCPLEGEGLHYVTLYFKAEWDQTQEPKNREPNKCEGWDFYAHTDGLNMFNSAMHRLINRSRTPRVR